MIRQTLAGALFALAMLSAASAQTTVQSGSSSTSGSTSTSGANSANSNNVAGAIGGTQVNAPISSTSGARANTRSTSTSQSGVSTVHASQRLGVTINNGAGSGDPPAGDPSGYVLSGGGSSTETLRNVPEIIAPNISGGNPCLVGVAGGVAVAGFGMTLGGGWEDAGCERRNSAALLNNIGEKPVAVALMCQDAKVRQAFAEAGEPCLADRPPQVATVAATQTDAAVIRRQQTAAMPPAPAQQIAMGWQKPASQAPKPHWCDADYSGPLPPKGVTWEHWNAVCGSL